MAQQQPPSPSDSPHTTAAPQAGAGFDAEQTFDLIDRLLPFEVCLYHQVLPLRIEGQSLVLGAVCPEDTSSLDYVRQMLAHTRYAIALQPISAQLQQHFLSAFLNYDRQIKASNSDLLWEDHGQPLRDLTHTDSPTIPMGDLRAGDTVAVGDRPAGDLEPTIEQFQQDFEAALNAESGTPRGGLRDRGGGGEVERSRGTESLDAPVSRQPIPPLLKVKAPFADRHLSTLASLPPRVLAQELLQRAIVQGIGRLYLERQGDTGRVLCSQDGVLQAALEGIDRATFQGVLNELKILADLPLMMVERPKQVEIERRYEGELLLLRLRIVPGQDGEEGTLQVLRGAALKFYQQQQLTKLGQDALSLARKLQQQVAEIHARARLTPSISTEQMASLPELKAAVGWLASMLDSLE
jgi:type II secretory ATPase GspE/PulE/Tfp pilus assembly ATPase PilB-like protein